ncbi:MAG: Maf family protein [Chitinophagaceae bacterium]|jgi:septum formation protein|nr:Maf family protein [Chitinophagaceae bacterium]
MQTIILASSSPRRSQLLEWAEVPFEIIVKHSSEEYDPKMPAEDVPEFLAREKATLVWKSLHGNDSLHKSYESTLPVLAADTEVIMDGVVFGKPQTRNDAIDFLMRLSGKTHKVITGVAIYYQNQLQSFSDTTLVTFHEMEENELAYYVDKYGPYDKAGGYAIQEWIGVHAIKRIEGDFYNVMGLPVSRVVRLLKKLTKT